MKNRLNIFAVLFALVTSVVVSTASDAQAADGLSGRLCESLTGAGGCISPITTATLYFYNLDPATFQVVGYAGTTTTNASGSFGKTLTGSTYYQVTVGYYIGTNYYTGGVVRVQYVGTGYFNIGNTVPYSPF